MPFPRTRIALLLVLAAGVTGCGGGDDAPTEPARPDTPFTRAADATREAGSADVEVQATTQGGDGPRTSAFGTADLRSGVAATSGTVTEGEASTTVESFTDGKTPYVKRDEGAWEVDADAQGGVLPASATEAIAFAEATDGEPGSPGTAASGGGVASLYETTVSMRALAEVVEGGAERFGGDGTLPILIYVGRDDGRLLRVTVTQPDAEGGEAAVDVSLRSFGEAEAPETPQDLPAG